MFHGHGMQDQDLLNILDEIAETLGASIAPHFYLCKKVAQDRLNYRTNVQLRGLLRRLNIHTIEFESYEACAKWLKSACKAAWEQPYSSCSGAAGSLQLAIPHPVLQPSEVVRAAQSW